MSKTKRPFNHRYDNDDYFEDADSGIPSLKRDRRKEKRIDNALRTKNIDVLIELGEDEEE